MPGADNGCPRAVTHGVGSGVARLNASYHEARSRVQTALPLERRTQWEASARLTP